MAAADPISTANFTASAGTSLLNLNANALGILPVVNAGIGPITAKANNPVNSQGHTSSASADLATAALLGSGNIPIVSASQTAPPDNATPATFGPVNIPLSPLLNVSAVNGSAQARSAAAGTCLASGVPLSTSPVNAASADVLTSIAGLPAPGLPVAHVGAVSSAGSTSLVSAAGPNDTRAVQAKSGSTLSTVSLFGGALTINVSKTSTLTATANGSTGGSTVSFDGPTSIAYVVAGQTFTVQAHSTTTIPLNVGLINASVDLSYANFTTVLAPDGTSAQSSGSVLSLRVRANLPFTAAGTLADVTLDLGPRSASATAPRGGVQCGQITPPTTAAPTITSPVDNTVTNNNRPPISGNGTPGAIVTVSDGTTPICTATVGSGGTYSCTPTAPLSDGPHSLSATQTPPGGTMSGQSNIVHITVDTMAPMPAPVITSPGSGTTVTTNMPPIIGTGTSGDTITVKDGGGNTVCTAVVDSTGHWTCTPTTEFPDGSVTIIATETDTAGNSTDSAPVTITVNTQAATVPAPVITSPTNSSTVNQGTVAFTGTGVAGDTVTVFEGGQALCSAVVDSTNKWTCTPTAGLSAGSHTVVATQTDTAGKTSGPSNTVTFTITIVGTQFVPKSPYRVLDTRPDTKVGSTTGPVALGGSVTLSAAQLKVPAGTASAVVINLTVDAPAEAGFVTAYPSDQPRPVVSSLNFAKGQTRANLVIVPVAADGSITLYAQQQTQLVADVFGYFATQAVTDSGLFHPLTPSRLLDTRVGNNTPLGTNETRNLAVTGTGGVPASGVEAVVLNVTVSRPTGAGYVSAFPKGAAFDNMTSNVNFQPGDLASTRVIVPVGTDGSVSFYNFNGSTPLVVDVTGWFSATGSQDTTGAQFVAVDPARVIDSRFPSVGTTGGALGAGETRPLQLTGGANVPTAGTVAVVSNLTAVNPTVDGFFTQFPTGTARPLASDVNFVANEVVANLTLGGVSAAGQASVYNLAGSTDVLEDVSGYFRVLPAG